MQKGIAGLALILSMLVIGGAVVGVAFYLDSVNNRKITDFESCAKAGNPVLESYPAQCNTKDGRHFVQQLTDEEKKKLVPPSSESGQVCIQVITPAKNSKTGECKEFATPCEVPGGWDKVESCSVNPRSRITMEKALLRPDGEWDIDLSNSNLTVFPQDLFKLKNIKALFLNNNKFVSLPNQIVQFKKLELLDLTGNPMDLKEVNRLRSLLPNTNVLFLIPMSPPSEGYNR